MNRREDLIARLSDTWPHDLSAADPAELPLCADDLRTVLDDWAPIDFIDALADIDTDELASRACRRDEMHALAGVGALVIDALYTAACKSALRDVQAHRDTASALREISRRCRETREGHFGVASMFGGAR